MLRVGLTGGVASGKSTVARLLAMHGAGVADADAIVEELYRPGGAGLDAARTLFGARIVGDDGGVDRRTLGRLVLADAKARQCLEAAIHPLVHARIAAWFAALAGKADPPRVAVVEAALLVETGSYADYQRLVVVSAPMEVRRGRALACGWSSRRFERVVAAQADDARRNAVADYIIRNDAGVEALGDAVPALWLLLQEDAAAAAAGRPLPPRRSA